MKQVELSLETAKEMYNSNIHGLKQFALENYSKEELEAKQLPKTWEKLKKVTGSFITRFSEIEDSIRFDTDENNKNIFATREQAKASIAMAQLSQLMQVYNDGWVPDWKNDQESKYVISFENNKLVRITYWNLNKFLAFKTLEIRDEFFTNFSELILQAKPLL